MSDSNKKQYLIHPIELYLKLDSHRSLIIAVREYVINYT